MKPLEIEFGPSDSRTRFECDFIKVANETYAIAKLKRTEGVAIACVEKCAKELVDALSAEHCFDRLALKDEVSWVEVVVKEKRFNGFRRIRGAVSHCASIEIPYLMLGSASFSQNKTHADRALAGGAR